MKKIMKRINGMIRIAQKRQESSQNEVDKLIGRQVERNLKMVKRIIGEEIVQCGQCKYFASANDALECGYINETTAEIMERESRGFCTFYTKSFKIPTYGFCHAGERISKEQQKNENEKQKEEQ